MSTGLEKVAHCMGNRRDEGNEIKSTDRFRGSPLSAKRKAESAQRLTPLKRNRVNQHKVIDYFLHRSKAAFHDAQIRR
ncbi:hypothetical protein [Burkholderia sp. RF2-non_BP3]|uniref:hypothetical protein n=1 Tax=Burkholderia sp. RF2-non_BP3 TaxID=1637844 RepID=UPI0012E3DB9A|nr:hypothetical protein [Burkholderia sp. RF2-non_BP3]